MKCPICRRTTPLPSFAISAGSSLLVCEECNTRAEAHHGMTFADWSVTPGGRECWEVFRDLPEPVVIRILKEWMGLSPNDELVQTVMETEDGEFAVYLDSEPPLLI